MPNRDLAHEWTDEELKKLERRIARVYREARNELDETVKAYFESFRKRDEEMRKLIGTVQNGKEWTEEDYKQWKLNQIGRGRRFEALREKIAERMTHANEIAIAYVNGDMPKIYARNYNYIADSIQEQLGVNLDFTVLNEDAVRRLIVEEPDSMPYYPPDRAVKRGIDLAYGKQQITSCVTSSILQGKSLKGMADDLQRRIPTMNRNSAIRAARTATTGAQNAGRLAAAKRAEGMGVISGKRWDATIDSRTRHSHRRLDGEVVGLDEKFSNGCRFPGDPRGKPAEVYNCRCRMGDAVVTRVKWNRSRKGRNPETGKWETVTQEMYDEWKRGGR